MWPMGLLFTFCLSISLSVTKSCAHFSKIADCRDLKLCTISCVQCFIIISRCAYCQDRRIQLFSYELWWIQEGWKVLKNLYLLFLIESRGRLETLYNMSFSFGDVHIIGTGGSNYELWWIKEGWRV
jgi:hypothetical protein